MAFHFDRDESVADGIQRLLEERLERAIQRLTESDHPTDCVHDLRKDIKKARAIFRLVQSYLERKAYRTQTEMLREISNLLAAVRDAEVHLQTLTELSTYFKSGNNKSFRTIRGILEKGLQRAQNDFSADNRHLKALKLLRSAKSGIRDLRLAKLEDDWGSLSQGFWDTYKRGKKGLARVQKNGDPEQFHEWRKLVKRLWYQVRLISPAWPVLIEALSDEVGCLGERLGADHDLFVLETIIQQQPSSILPKHERAYLLSFTAKRQVELRREALRLGEQVYSEKPARFCKRMGLYWNSWRHHSARQEGDTH